MAGYDASLIFAIRPRFEFYHPCACFPASFLVVPGEILGWIFYTICVSVSMHQDTKLLSKPLDGQRQLSWPDGLESLGVDEGEISKSPWRKLMIEY